MSAVFHTDDPRPGPSARPTSPSATEGHDDGTTGHPSAGATGPATAPVDKSHWKFCRGCNQPRPPEGWALFRCAACAAKAKNSPNRWVFNERGDLISKGTKPTKAKAPAATGAFRTNKEQSK